MPVKSPYSKTEFKIHLPRELNQKKPFTFQDFIQDRAELNNSVQISRGKAHIETLQSSNRVKKFKTQPSQQIPHYSVNRFKLLSDPKFFGEDIDSGLSQCFNLKKSKLHAYSITPERRGLKKLQTQLQSSNRQSMKNSPQIASKAYQRHSLQRQKNKKMSESLHSTLQSQKITPIKQAISQRKEQLISCIQIQKVRERPRELKISNKRAPKKKRLLGMVTSNEVGLTNLCLKDPIY